MTRRLSVFIERFPIAGRFTIARGSRTEAVVVVAAIEGEGALGRGECVPYARYGESVEGVAEAIQGMAPLIEAGEGREALRRAMPAGAARNALDCALWDWEAKRAGVPAVVLAGLHRLSPATTAYTLSLDAPEAMEEAARANAERPILKVKLGAAEDDPGRIRAVRRGAPDAVLLVDANEGWRPENLAANVDACAEAGVALIEQPLPAGEDAALGLGPHGRVRRPVPFCADESAHDLSNLERLADLYDAVNIKLDKAGGLTEALLMAERCERQSLGIMVGCMVATSLAMAPAMLLAGRARFVDLDGPLLLARDREPGLRYEGGVVYPPERALWG